MGLPGGGFLEKGDFGEDDLDGLCESVVEMMVMMMIMRRRRIKPEKKWFLSMVGKFSMAGSSSWPGYL